MKRVSGKGGLVVCQFSQGKGMDYETVYVSFTSAIIQ